MNRYPMLLAALSLIGCLKTRGELRAEETDNTPQRVTILGQHQARETRVAKNEARQAAQPAYHPQEETDEQLRTLSGRIDVVENQIVQLNASKSGDKDSVV